MVPPKAGHPERDSFAFQWKLRFARKAEPAHILWGRDYLELPYKLKKGEFCYLDCGCGSGEMVREVALRNPTVQAVGLDISEGIRLASERDRGIRNLHYVQGDILSPPFRKGSFYFIMCLGVLHHTRDVKEALNKTIDLLDRPGFLSLWLYPNLDDLREAAEEHRKWRRYYFIRDRLFLNRSPRINQSLLLSLCKIISFFISPFMHVLNHPLADLKLRYLSNTFVLLDNLSPTYQHRIRKQEVLRWFKERGINKVVYSFERGGLYTAMRS